MATATLTQKGQITIPKKIRQKLNLKPNHKIIFVMREGQIIMKPVRDILSLRGAVPVTKEQDFNKIRQQVIKDIGEHNAKE